MVEPSGSALFAPHQERGIMNETMLAIGGLGTPELLVIAVVIFLLFGATRLPQLAKSLGQSRRAFKEGLEEGEKEAQKEDKEK
jgi:sec-independent protein translocase protein TatA